METIKSKALLDSYLDRCRIRSLFGKELPHFLLLHYSPGEILTSPFSPTRYLQFVADGELLLYDMPDESRTITLQNNSRKVNMVGEMELLDNRFVPFFVEARSDVYTLAVYLDQYRDLMLNDPVFLRYICSSLAEKLAMATREASYLSLEERVRASLRFAEPGQTIGNIADTAASLGVSSRQLMRVLKSFCEEEILLHEKKGVYRVLRKP